jgi:hypothetical protein
MAGDAITNQGLELEKRRKQAASALGTVDLFQLPFQNQRVANLKLLKVVDLTIHRVSTSAPAIPTGACRKQRLKSPGNQPY